MRKKGAFTTVMLILILLLGLSLLLYPWFSDHWNSLHQSRAIAQYVEKVATLDKEDHTQLWEAARTYNRSLLTRENAYVLSDAQQEEYSNLLNISGGGIMGYIQIPAIDCDMPIYHGTDETVLQVAVGHLEWTSLPTGGTDTHCVISGHRGLPSARLFTDLDQLLVGDVFMLRVLDEVMTYEVDQILIVEPEDTHALLIEEGKDFCTLVTCTPYGINSHRLLVRGHRIENLAQSETIRVTADAIQVESLLVAAVLMVPALLILLVLVRLGEGRKKTKE